MKLKVRDVNTSYKEVVTETDKVIGHFNLDVSGFYYWEHIGSGWFEATTLRQIARLLDKLNEPFKKQLEEEFKLKIEDKVTVKNEGYNYSTYRFMFKELGFKDPQEPKEFRSIYPTRKSHKEVVFTIFNTGIHQDGTPLFAIRDLAGNEFLFSEGGLRRHEEEIDTNF